MLEESRLHAENEVKNKLANDSLGDVMNQVQDVNGVKLLAVEVKDVDMNGLRNLGDQLKREAGRRRCPDCIYSGWQGKPDGFCNWI